MKNWIKLLDRKNYKDFKDGIYSQSYQDVLLEYIFSNIETKNNPPFCVEFGFNTDSLDKKNSGINVLNLIRNHKWDFLLLDGIRENTSINLYKHFLTSENICEVLEKYKIPKSPEYISIDVDSTDMWLFESVIKKYKPMVISVEYNCNFPHDKAITFPNNTNFSCEGDRSYGASLKALKIVGEKNGYSLLWVVKYLDAFFIRNDLIEDGSDNICFPYDKWINHCNLLAHKRSKENKLLNQFIDYEVYLESNYNIEASKKAAKNVTKEYLISNPLSLREIKYTIHSSLEFINERINFYIKNPLQLPANIFKKIYFSRKNFGK